MNILVIGAGNMGMTYIQSFLRARIVRPENMMVLCRTYPQASRLAEVQEGRFFSDPAHCVSEADLIVLAVKPQDSATLFEQIKPFVSKDQVFLSIMAGVTMDSISAALDARKVVRAMPNLPARIGAGTTAYTSTDAVTRIELVMVQNLLNTTGKTVYVERENMMDAATAISGSGPAYVFFFMRAMMEAASEMGFSEQEAELLVSQTFSGAVDLYNRSDDSCGEWIGKVASKGGTTEAALRQFNGLEVHDAIKSGCHAARNRAEELGAKK